MNDAIDLPARVPRTPDGAINVEQLRREYEGTGNRHLAGGTFADYLAAVVAMEANKER